MGAGIMLRMNQKKISRQDVQRAGSELIKKHQEHFEWWLRGHLPISTLDIHDANELTPCAISEHDRVSDRKSSK